MSDVQEASLYDLALLVVRRWRILAGTTAAVLALALAVALFTTPVYRASAIIAPQAIDAGLQSNLGALGGSLGGLASLAGLGGGDGGSIEQNLAVLRSRVLAEAFIAENDLRKRLFPDKWDETTNSWRKPSLIKRLLIAVSKVLNQGGKDSYSADGGPTSDETWRAFDESRTVAVDKETGLVTVSLESRTPMEAAVWTQMFIRHANEYIRTKEIAEGQARLAYLSNQASSTTISEVRDAISKLMESELKQSMLANVRTEFAFKTIDPAVKPETQAWPKRGLLVAAGLIAGLMLGLFIILVSGYIQAMRDARQE